MSKTLTNTSRLRRPKAQDIVSEPNGTYLKPDCHDEAIFFTAVAVPVCWQYSVNPLGMVENDGKKTLWGTPFVRSSGVGPNSARCQEPDRSTATLRPPNKKQSVSWWQIQWRLVWARAERPLIHSGIEVLNACLQASEEVSAAYHS